MRLLVAIASAFGFIGPPELFRTLDTDGDGRICADEAEAARTFRG